MAPKYTSRTKLPQRPRKKETRFYGRTDLPSRVGRSGHFFLNILFSFWKQKWPSKTTESPKKSIVFCRKNVLKICSDIFKKSISAKLFKTDQKQLILHDSTFYKKKIQKQKQKQTKTKTKQNKTKQNKKQKKKKKKNLKMKNLGRSDP